MASTLVHRIYTITSVVALYCNLYGCRTSAQPQSWRGWRRHHEIVGSWGGYGELPSAVVRGGIGSHQKRRPAVPRSGRIRFHPYKVADRAAPPVDAHFRRWEGRGYSVGLVTIIEPQKTEGLPFFCDAPLVFDGAGQSHRWWPGPR